MEWHSAIVTTPRRAPGGGGRRLNTYGNTYGRYSIISTVSVFNEVRSTTKIFHILLALTKRYWRLCEIGDGGC